MKVLHGMSEIAGQGFYSVRGLNENGIEAQMSVWRENLFGYGCDYNLKIGRCKWLYPYYAVKMFIFAVYAAFKYDCFHFHFGWSLLPGGMDLWVLKLFKKKVFMEFHGSDIRWSFNRQKYDGMPLPPESRGRQKRIKKILKYVDGVILHDEELRKHLPDTKVPVYIIPLRIDLDAITPAYPAEDVGKPIIVHAPSKRGGKGTEYVLKALEGLDADFEFILVEGKSQKEALEIYKTADIIIDQLLAGTYGVFAIESMAMGKPVFTYVDRTMAGTFPEELPIICSDKDMLGRELEKLIHDAERRKILGVRGRKYVEKYHDYKRNARALLKIYQGEYPELRGREAFTYLNTLDAD